MPLHDVGYRGWEGNRQAAGTAVAVIALTGLRLAWTSRWLRRVVFFAWSPAMVFAASFFAFEQAVEEGRLTTMTEAARAGRNLDGVGMLGTVLADALGGGAESPEAVRHLVWTRLLLAFMRAPQAILLAAVVGLVAPTLISRDLRAKAWLVYFTRPVGRTEYILGKAVILFLLVAAITMLPGLALWVMGVLVSPSIDVAWQTCDLPLKIIVASVTLAIPTVLLALAYSSLTAESRIASFAWFATWLACWIAHGALVTADLVATARQAEASLAQSERPRRPFSDEEELLLEPRPRRPAVPFGGRFRWLVQAAGIDPTVDRWAWLSPYHALGAVQARIFGIDRRLAAWLPSAISLTLIAVGSIAVLAWRVDAPSKA
jgi:ABC-2 type transport system permease protein